MTTAKLPPRKAVRLPGRLCRQRLSSPQCCVHHATAAPIFTDTGPEMRKTPRIRRAATPSPPLARRRLPPQLWPAGHHKAGWRTSTSKLPIAPAQNENPAEAGFQPSELQGHREALQPPPLPWFRIGLSFPAPTFDGYFFPCSSVWAFLAPSECSLAWTACPAAV